MSDLTNGSPGAYHKLFRILFALSIPIFLSEAGCGSRSFVETPPICDCGPRETCVDGMCQCDEGFENQGQRCVALSACSSISCWGHGECEIDGDGEPVCICEPGYHLEGLTGCVANEPAGFSNVCNENGLCWDNPYPQGNPLHAIWASSANDVWAVGSGGTIIHWDGENWSGSMDEVLGNYAWRGYPAITFRNMWGSAPDDLWVAGYRYSEQGRTVIIRHWDGTSWSDISHPFGGNTSWVTAIFGFGSDDVWFAGLMGPDSESWEPVLWRWHQSRWHQADIEIAEGISGLWGASPDDLWATTYDGAVFHWDGEVWTSVVEQQGIVLFDIWGTHRDDIWVVGEEGLALHFDGIQWSTVETGFDDRLVRIWGSDEDDYWVVRSWSEPNLGSLEEMLHWNGTEWRSLSIEGDYSTVVGISGVDAGDVWFVTDNGGIQRWNGTEWRRVDRGTREHLRDLWPGDEVSNQWAAGENGVVLQRTDRGWEQLEVLISEHLDAVFSFASGEVWVGGNQTDLFQVIDLGEEIIRWPMRPIQESWVSDGHVLAASFGTVWHWTGDDWGEPPCVERCMRFTMLDGSGYENILAVGSDRATRHFDGTQWSHVLEPAESGYFSGLSCVPGGDCFLTQSRPNQLLRWSGQEWEFFDELPVDISEIWAESENSLWVLGRHLHDRSSLFHWDGQWWTAMAPVGGGSYELFINGSTSGTRPGLWVYGTRGVILHKSL